RMTDYKVNAAARTALPQAVALLRHLVAEPVDATCLTVCSVRADASTSSAAALTAHRHGFYHTKQQKTRR
ncbi:MAG: hypothetical protein LBS86_06780, partial [Treponema sp.]|nr:hypothetical protein [Treponema sp.]